ncbi:MAG: sugar ABC transporter substrate-binding protein [Candidatus Wallbacteria bacterium]
MRNIIYILALILVIITSASGHAYSKEFRAGVLYWSQNIEGQVAMSKGLEDEAAKINKEAALRGKPAVKLEIKVAGDGQRGIENQVKQMYDLISSGVDIIIVQPTDNAALAEPLKLANKLKIPVVAYDQYISGGTLAAYRTSDNYQGGYIAGEYIASKFAGKKTINLVLVEYPHVSSTVERVNGFLDGLSQSKISYKVLKSYLAVEPVSGKKAALGILKDFPERGSIDVIFTVNDGGGLAVARQLNEAGRNEIKIATFDGDPQSIENIKNGILTVIDSAQFCGPLGAEAMKAAYSILTGEKTAFHAVVPTFPVTLETLKMYPGWHGPIPAEFKKTWKSVSPNWNGSLRIIKP